ncbi:hypothetical protein OIU84_013182 [Salix udensis]|uniref:Uncharacterized protein n=1 Tax=Salix udensis TaxID=889485 RepID=A0AAD6JHE7_9ROSI|nr:hypothetical protein OIU84_013182 [Salix udensis]
MGTTRQCIIPKFNSRLNTIIKCTGHHHPAPSARPYYYGYSLQAPRAALSGPQAQRMPGPSYLYFPNVHGGLLLFISFSNYSTRKASLSLF